MKWKKTSVVSTPSEQFPVDALFDDGNAANAPLAGDADDDVGNASVATPIALPLPAAGSAVAAPMVTNPLGALRPRAIGAAQILHDWAVRWDVEDDPYVERFTSAVNNGGDLTFWANLDPTEALPTPSGPVGQVLSRVARVIAAVRNIAVFVPVAITWFAINKSTNAFAEYAASKAGQEVNFLQFWQSGGDNGTYLSDFWRIGSVAFVDALIIAMIVVATLVASSLQARADAVMRRGEALAERERTAVAIQIGEALQGNRQADPESITEALAVSLNSLSAAARDVSDAAGRMEQATSGVAALAPRMADLSQHVEKLSIRLGQDVTRSVDSLVSSVSTLGVTMGGDMQKFLSDILAGLEEINEQLGRTSVSVEFGTKQLRDDLDAMHQQLSQVVGRRS